LAAATLIMTADKGQTGLCDLPNELLLDIIEKIPYDPHTYGAIFRTNQHLHSLVRNHSGSLTQHIAEAEFPTECRIYPQQLAPHLANSSNLEWLALLRSRSFIVKRTCDLVMQGVTRYEMSPQQTWIDFITIGLHHLYKLSDLKIYSEMVLFLDSLPLLSLSFIFVTLVLVLDCARPKLCFLSPGYEHLTDIQRMEFHLCLEECSLFHGPDFIYSILTQLALPGRSICKQITWCSGCVGADKILKSEYDNFKEREYGTEDGTSPSRTLISCLKQAIKTKAGCSIRLVYETAWHTVQEKEVMENSASFIKLAFL
jgi:hypothetical protein